MGFFSSLGSIGGFLGGVGSLVGGIMGSSNQRSANKANAALANEQFQFQKDYIKNQLQWKVDDAQKAGLHPMAALGIQSPGFSPVSANQSGVDYSWLGDIGQVANYASTIGKTKSQQKDMLELQVRGLELDNEYKQAQIDQMRVDTLASTIASDQALSSPGAPSLNSQSPVVSSQTGLVTPEGSATHIWDMGHGNYSILWNPDYTQSIGDEAGQVFNIAEASKKAYKDGTFVDPETGVTYVYNKDSGWWNRLDALSDEEARRLLGSVPARVSGPSASHRVRNAYRYR